jgi:uncharacterized NAD(P)/FAD-binding protein YdhS
MNDGAPATVVIVGGGASGVLAALRLLESSASKSGKIRIILVESKETVGRGVAYGTGTSFHLLNVRQNQMSAHAEDPEHFSRWIARAYPAEMTNAFQPRRTFGEYLGSALEEARRARPPEAFRVLKGEARGFSFREDGKIEVEVSGREAIEGDRLVLAAGLRSPRVPLELRSIEGSARFVSNPWNPASIGAIGKNERVLLVGAGLTTVDFVLSLMRGGHRAPIDVLSRHGLSPLAHRDSVGETASDLPMDDRSVRGVMRALRAAGRAAGEHWPGVIDRFRPEVTRIWRDWDELQRGRFLRHARPYWEVHRHRVAPEVHREWDLYRRAGKIQCEAGRVRNAVESTEGVRIRVEWRSGGVTEKFYDRVVNCTGAMQDLTLLEGHDFLKDPFGLGIPTDRAGRPYRSEATPEPTAEPRLFIFGPALRSHFWEMTAIPDLRTQAKTMTDVLIDGLPK